MTPLLQRLDELSNANHADPDYFDLIRQAVHHRREENDRAAFWQERIDHIYRFLEDEIRTNTRPPLSPISFGTSGWRGILGKDINCHTVAIVTQAIIDMYRGITEDAELAAALGVADLAEARQRGAIIGHDNRFGGALFAETAFTLLSAAGFTVYMAGESTTGALSAAVMELNAAFSINITPSHNPLDYAGFKFNGADAGPAAPLITNTITTKARALLTQGPISLPAPDPDQRKNCDALTLWQHLLKRHNDQHGLDLDTLLERHSANGDFVLAVDCVHGATRVHIDRLLARLDSNKIIHIRTNADPTFAGIAPEPSDANMAQVMALLQQRPEPFKLGVIMDPDGDRIRFTDGETIINMNAFGAMAYHFLHEEKKKTGLVAKTVATSNMANGLAKAFGEEVFEPRVGFKEFKPVLSRALVCFEESDGITVIGHTPEKDAYIGLTLALDMILTRQENLGDYLVALQKEYGAYYPAKDSVTVSQKGEELLATLDKLRSFTPQSTVRVGEEEKTIGEVIAIDGLKLIFEDGSWLLIRPSGTEPKVRFYVEARTASGMKDLFATARKMLADLGL